MTSHVSCALSSATVRWSRLNLRIGFSCLSFSFMKLYLIFWHLPPSLWEDYDGCFYVQFSSLKSLVWVETESLISGGNTGPSHPMGTYSSPLNSGCGVPLWEVMLWNGHVSELTQVGFPTVWPLWPPWWGKVSFALRTLEVCSFGMLSVAGCSLEEFGEQYVDQRGHKW